MSEIYYKYRSLSNCDQCARFMDIIENNRLWASDFEGMNDPMEGFYWYYAGDVRESIKREIKNGKLKLKICSLSKRSDIYLMWSLYADALKGVVVGIEIDDIRINPTDIIVVDYFKKSEDFKIDKNGSSSRELACRLLKRKTYAWHYEEEVRILSKEEHIKVKIKEVRLGSKMEPSRKEWLRKFISNINDGIVIKELSYEEDDMEMMGKEFEKYKSE